MFETEKGKREVLSYTLLALSLVLYFCWKNKKKYESMKSGYMYGAPRQTDGFRSKSLMSSLDFGKANRKVKNKNLNEMEAYVINRHPVKESFKDNDFSALKWATESFTADSGETLGEDILTPLKTETETNVDITTSGMQLTRSDNTSHYVPRSVTI